MPHSRPSVLCSCDDGVQAPGFRALVGALVSEDIANVYVSAPDGERSAQAHAITLGNKLTCTPTEFQEACRKIGPDKVLLIAGVTGAYAVSGTPADCVMLAMNSPVFKDQQFDLVLSGINIGDNLGLHVIYSGTVGAAREAALKGVPAMAFSLDDYNAKTLEAYHASATYCVALAKAALGLLSSTEGTLQQLIGSILNVNIPAGHLADIRGLYLAHQGNGCFWPAYVEDFQEVHEHQNGKVELKMPPMLAEAKRPRTFKLGTGSFQGGDSPECDTAVIRQGWVAVTPLGLRSDIPFGDRAYHNWGPVEKVPAVAAKMIAAVAIALGVDAGGISKL